MPEQLHILGKISGYYGVKGWVKIYSYTQPRENIVHYKKLKIKFANTPIKESDPAYHSQWQDIVLSNGKAHGKGVVAHFSGYDDRDLAAKLIGAELAVYRSDFKSTEKDEYYWADLIGLTVVNAEDVELGKITKLIETATNDVLVIKPSFQKSEVEEILVPFVMHHFIKHVDLEKGMVLVDWPVEWNG